METTQKREYPEAFITLCKVLAEAVSEIESAPQVYKGHYQEYVNLLDGLNKRFPEIEYSLWEQVLRKLGANEYGVRSAITLLYNR